MLRERKAELILLLVTLLWGATFVVTKQGLNSAPPILFLALRFAAASLLLYPAARTELKRLDGRLLRRGLILGGLMFAGYAFQNASLVYTTAGRSALITYFFALLVPFLQVPLTGKPLRAANILGLAVVVAGLVLLNLPRGEGINLGDALALGSAVCYAFYIVFIDRYTREGGALALTFMQFVLTALLSLILSLSIEAWEISFDGNLIWALFYLAFFGSFLCLSLMNRFQKDVTPVKAVIIYSMEPVFAVFFGMLFLAEGFTPAEWIGAALIIGGVLFSDLYPQKHGRNKNEDS